MQCMPLLCSFREEDGEFCKTEEVLDELGVNSITNEDCNNVRRICKVVSERAAYLASAGTQLKPNFVIVCCLCQWCTSTVSSSHSNTISHINQSVMHSTTMYVRMLVSLASHLVAFIMAMSRLFGLFLIPQGQGQ